MKSVAKRHGRFTLSPPHRSHFASCFLCDVDVSEVHSNLRVLLRVPEYPGVVISNLLNFCWVRSLRCIKESRPCKCRNARVLSINFCMSNCGFSSIFKIFPGTDKFLRVLFNEISYQEYKGRMWPCSSIAIHTMGEIGHPRHGQNTKQDRLGHRMMGSTWLVFRFAFLDPFLHCTVQCFYNAHCNHAKGMQIMQVLSCLHSRGPLELGRIASKLFWNQSSSTLFFVVLLRTSHIHSWISNLAHPKSQCQMLHSHCKQADFRGTFWSTVVGIAGVALMISGWTYKYPMWTPCGRSSDATCQTWPLCLAKWSKWHGEIGPSKTWKSSQMTHGIAEGMRFMTHKLKQYLSGHCMVNGKFVFTAQKNKRHRL